MTTPNKYQREIRPGVIVDVYDVLRAWNVTCPALQHLIKKALQPGARGHKTAAEDLDDIVASAIRARDLQDSASNEAISRGYAQAHVGPLFGYAAVPIEFPRTPHNPPQPKTFEDAKQ